MTSDSDSENRPFWTFSLDVYARPGIADACLSLQDRHGCDVNIVLFCCWAASTGAGRLDDQTIADAVASVAEWQTEVIKPVRAVRRRLEAEFTHVDPKMASELKIEIGAAELHAESVEQNVLEKLIAPERASRSDSAAQMEDAQYNLLGYLKLLGVETNNDALESLSTIVTGCCAKL
ncbi:MAG: TIGR02444 family protein [Gammaproteobacteria bacterium]